MITKPDYADEPCALQNGQIYWWGSSGANPPVTLTRDMASRIADLFSLDPSDHAQRLEAALRAVIARHETHHA
jgi:hypothetical protein